MAKPILIVRTPQRRNLADVRAQLNTQFKGEYHVLMVINPDEQTDVLFEVHNAENLKPSELSDLRKAVYDHNKPLKKAESQVLTDNTVN